MSLRYLFFFLALEVLGPRELRRFSSPRQIPGQWMEVGNWGRWEPCLPYCLLWQGQLLAGLVSSLQIQLSDTPSSPPLNRFLAIVCLQCADLSTAYNFIPLLYQTAPNKSLLPGKGAFTGHFPKEVFPIEISQSAANVFYTKVNWLLRDLDFSLLYDIL